MPFLVAVAALLIMVFGLAAFAVGARLAMILWNDNAPGTLSALSWNIEALTASVLMTGGACVVLLALAVMVLAEWRMGR